MGLSYRRGSFLGRKEVAKLQKGLDPISKMFSLLGVLPCAGAW